MRWNKKWLSGLVVAVAILVIAIVLTTRSAAPMLKLNLDPHVASAAQPIELGEADAEIFGFLRN